MCEMGVIFRENEVNEFRHRMHISVMGGDIPAPITTFSEMSFRKDQETLKRHILHNIEGLGNDVLCH